MNIDPQKERDEYTALQDRIYNLRDHIEAEVGNSTMQLIEELIRLEIEIESNCNK
jgi:hypothetical protein